MLKGLSYIPRARSKMFDSELVLSRTLVFITKLLARSTILCETKRPAENRFTQSSVFVFVNYSKPPSSLAQRSLLKLLNDKELYAYGK